ncbi:MAG: indolepyruvate ferredoxin oxidoreductase family protein [Burkholderiaceae bacterium]
MNAPDIQAARFSLDDRYRVESGQIYLSGTQALVRLMLDQRRRDERAGLNTAGFVSGYPGSPVGQVDDEMLAARPWLDEQKVVFQPGQNEELAATAVFGTQTLHEVPGARYDGVFSMWYGKAPGVDRSGDAFHHHNFRGTARHGGVLAVAGDDPHARSTIFPSDSNSAFYKFFMPLLAPADVQEVIDLGLHGFALSRASGLWVGMKFVTDVADSAGVAEVGPDRIRPVLPEVPFDGKPLVPELRMNDVAWAMIETERRIVDGQLEIARRYAALNDINRITGAAASARIGLVTGGKTWVDLCQALHDLGLDESALVARGIRLLKMGMLYPVEPGIVRRFADGLDEIIVIEDKRPFLELFIKDILYGLPQRPRVLGKLDDEGRPLLPAYGELSADAIARALLARVVHGLNESPIARDRVALLHRPKSVPIALSTSRLPYFCSGCPHNTSLKAPEGAVVGAGIGCHIMDLWMGKGFGIVKGYTQMGGEGAQWVGLAPFTDTPHFFQNLGDGTFAHSGSVAVRFSVASGRNITYKILYNSTVAMTGGQRVQGAMSVADMVKALEADGVRRIIVTSDEPEQFSGDRIGSATVWHRDRLIEAERALAATPGTTVLLHVQQCATEKRRLRKRGRLDYKPMWATINPRVCEGCGDCGEQSNCLSVQPVATDFGRKTQIHLSSCNQDFSCLKGDCPSFATVETSAESPGRRRRAPIDLPRDLSIPEPVTIVPTERFSVCLTGIGGTGVVTVNQVLGTAAFTAGMRVQTYDHTGSSQKAGPVVSHLKVIPPDQTGSPTVGTGEADCYLVFDALVGVNPNNLATTHPDKTVAVVSCTEVPTGEMIADRGKRFPEQAQLRASIDAGTRRESNHYLDAQALAERLLGDHMASNLLLVGVAYQAGALPIPADAIEQAIRLNARAVEMNLAAFRWGRLWVVDRQRVEQAARPQAEILAFPEQRSLPDEARSWVNAIAATGELARAVELRVAELIAYQGMGLAKRYAERVATVRRAEAAVVGERSELTLAVARNLYKLMAVKDEYEVARLLLDQAEQSRIAGIFGPDARVSWHLHPTFLRRLGVQRKVRFGPWFRPVLKLLRAARRVRGGPLDVFSRSRIRATEKALLQHYEKLIDVVLASLNGAHHADAVALLDCPDQIRGYEDVKMRSIQTYLEMVRSLAEPLGIDATQGSQLFDRLAAARELRREAA